MNKKNICQNFFGVAFAVCLLSPPVTSANAVEIGGDIGMFSQYVWRGIPQNNSLTALQGDLVLDTGTGLSASVWFSNTGYPAAPQFGSRKVVEFDWTLDYSGSVNGINYSLGSAYYTYLYDGNSNFSELYGALSLDASFSPSITAYYMQASPKGSIAYMKGDMWFDLGVSTEVSNFSSSLTVSYTMYKADVLRPSNFYKSGLSTAVFSLSRDIAINEITVSPSLLLSLPLAAKDTTGEQRIYGIPAKTEFVAGVNINY